MSSYKCPQCGLVNWNVAEVCKRCAAPNPYLAPASSEAFQTPAPDVQGYQQQAYQQPAQQGYQQQYAPQQQAHNAQPQNHYGQQQYAQPAYDYNSPPPPNVYGAGAGAGSGYGYQQNQYPYQNRGYNSPDVVIPGNVADEVEKAMKMIKHAKIASRVWAILLGIATLLFLLLGAVISGSSAASKPGAQPVAAIMGFMTFFLFAFTAIIGGMSYGISRKSMVCAVIFLILTGLGILGSLSNFTDPDTGSKAIGQLGFSALMFFFAVRGVMGISTINKYKHQYPQIVAD